LKSELLICFIELFDGGVTGDLVEGGFLVGGLFGKVFEGGGVGFFGGLPIGG
jgi:hypothetical protein